MDRRKLSAIVAYLSRSVSAAALMIWGVFNIAALVIQYIRRTGDDGNWVASAGMCGFFGVLPFAIGTWLLYRTLASSNQQKNSKSESAT
ncbi:hypothetical protein [Mariniblastus fucicola]|uniref:Uncharacterized protein n=1 Tax=Mariniblastus fucicola TaxID=980251 RepID=A0A5B9P419_9BACT|nr:hypothetical protein [Mariniblastus fucicola]QEG21357.1 hypothetical protein MFFC18_12130 [Mariniblastus fucicola]